MTIKSNGGIFGRNPTFNIATASQFIGPVSGLATSAAALKSSATTGLMQITGPAAGATRTMTIPDANFSAARTDAGQTFTGVQVMTSPNIVTSINDTNGNEVLGITATASAVNELTVANAATGSNPTISATGTDTNIGVEITPKGTGNLVLTGGNLVVASGNGIDFSATAGTGTSELFDDYEEGTWTPAFQTSNNNMTVTHDVQLGFYTKTGNVVTCTGQIRTDAVSGGTGVVQVRGLPFTAKTTPAVGAVGVLSIAVADPWTAAPIGGYVNAGATSLDLIKTGQTVITPPDMTNAANSNGLWFSITYLTD